MPSDIDATNKNGHSPKRKSAMEGVCCVALRLIGIA